MDLIPHITFKQLKLNSICCVRKNSESIVGIYSYVQVNIAPYKVRLR